MDVRPEVAWLMDDSTRKTSATGSVIDLGDDLLLEKTRLMERDEDETEGEESDSGAIRQVELPRGPLDAAQVADLMHSVKILIGEGFLEDAKRILRKIILSDEGNIPARKKLEEIHEKELEQIFTDTENRRPSRFDDEEEDPLPKVDSEFLMRAMDRDLGLGVFEDGQAGEPMALEKRLFGGQDAVEKFAKTLETVLGPLGPRDRMDLGVAFFEMELFDLAARQFEAASHEPELEDSATAMLAQALILGDRAFEALLVLEPMIGITTVPREQKLEYMYLMGRANERLRKFDAALNWFRLVHEIDPWYRDTDDRYRFHLEEKLRAR
jgi:tetratricopeptide (TPR) repeat protein